MPADSIVDCLAFLVEHHGEGVNFDLSDSVATVTPHKGGQRREFPLNILTFALLQRNDTLAQELGRKTVEFNLSMMDRSALQRTNCSLLRKLRKIFDVSRTEFNDPSDDEVEARGEEQGGTQDSEDEGEGEGEGKSAKESQNGVKRTKRPGTTSLISKVKRPKTSERKRMFGYLHPNAVLLQNLLAFCDGRGEDVLSELALEIERLDRTKPVPRSIKKFPSTYQKAWNKFQRSRALYQEFLEAKYPEKVLQVAVKSTKKFEGVVFAHSEEEDEGAEEGDEGEDAENLAEEVGTAHVSLVQGVSDGVAEGVAESVAEGAREEKEDSSSSSGSSSSDSSSDSD